MAVSITESDATMAVKDKAEHMSLASSIDKVAALHFSQMEYFGVRDVAKEMVKLAANEVLMTRECEGLSDAQRDVAIKVAYVGLANDSPNSAAYFKWHAALCEQSGPGAIMRVLCDKEVVVAE
jgi:hypothetical protein